MDNGHPQRRVVIVLENADPTDDEKLLRLIAKTCEAYARRATDVDTRFVSPAIEPVSGIAYEQLETVLRQDIDTALTEANKQPVCVTDPKPARRRLGRWITRHVHAGWEFTVKVAPAMEKVLKAADEMFKFFQ